MTDIQKTLNDHNFQVQALLKKHKISGAVNIETIQKGYQQKGETFMMELLRIITPGANSNFTAEVYDDPMGDALAMQEANTNSATKGWAWWDNVLNYVSKTGETIGAVKQNVTGPQAAVVPPVDPLQEMKNTNMLYIIAAGFVALIIIILIFKK